jgi:hypothetical protein
MERLRVRLGGAFEFVTAIALDAEGLVVSEAGDSCRASLGS